MNVVFDLGAVVFAWEPAKLLHAHLPEQAPDAATASALARALFHHEDWVGFDRGTHTLEKALDGFARRLSLPRDALATLLGNLGERLAPIGTTLDLLRRLRERRDDGEDLRLFYLSNMPSPVARDLERLHGFMAWFDGGVFSGDVKFVKPDREIYELLAVRHNLAAEDTVFIDDTAANVEMARAFGWQAIHCVDPAALPAQLARFLQPRLVALSDR